MNKRILFYFVHPAKYHFFRVTINHLISAGYDVEIIITGRDILEELVKKEGWNYKLIFPKGRKIKGVHVYITAFIFLFVTIYKLLKITWGKKYSLFISDDLITFVGRLRRIPTIFVTDDDLSAVKESVILFWTANYIFAPDVCRVGKFDKKKIAYYGYKALAHLHPNHFKPDKSKIEKMFLTDKPYFFIRTVYAGSTHDMGKSGINDHVLRKMINFLIPYGNILLNSERDIPADLQQYICNINKNDIAHYIAFAKIFISDSSTMCAESAVLGVPTIEFNSWFHLYEQSKQLAKYGLVFYTFNEDELLTQLGLILENNQFKDMQMAKREQMLSDCVDVSSLLIWLIEMFPKSTEILLNNPDYQRKFK